MFFLEIMDKLYDTKVVPKLMLIHFGQTCNSIYQNSDKAHVFCSALTFQQASADIRMSAIDVILLCNMD